MTPDIASDNGRQGVGHAALDTSPNLSRPDDFYEALIEMHRDLDESTSQAVNARLILLLANHIGGHEVLLDAMRHARAGVTSAGNT